MKDFAALLQAIASLLWPIIVFILAILFKPGLTHVLRRLKRGKFFGQELELERDLNELDKNANASASEVAALPPAPEEEQIRSAQLGLITEDEVSYQYLQKFLELAESSPKVALMDLAVAIEKELREIIFSQGEVGKPYKFTMASAIKILETRGALPPHTLHALHTFRRIRNKIVHGSPEITSDEILRAIDSGTLILLSLKAIPRQKVYVRHPGVTLYSDPDGTVPLDEPRGVILEMIDSKTGNQHIGIYATTRTHFVKGKQVAWEWDNKHVWGPAWYRDPDTGETKQAWGGSVEFVGRSLEDT